MQEQNLPQPHLTPEQEDYQRRIEGFKADLSSIIERWGIQIVPKMVYSEFGLLPQIVYLNKADVDKVLGQKKEQDLTV